MTITLTPAQLVTAALDELVATIRGLGLPATRDPGDFQPPAAIVDPPTLTGPRTMGGLGLIVPVWIVADGSGVASTDQIRSAAVAILLELGESQADPTTWVSPINPAGLPAYLINVRMTIAQEE